LYLPRRF
jgi:hypothetical protein